MMAVRKNDTVIILTGKDKNKKGTVVEVLPAQGKVLVQGTNVAIRHAKARKQGEVSSIKKEEHHITISNVMPLCTACKKPTRLKVRAMDDTSKVRVCNHCDEIY